MSAFIHNVSNGRPNLHSNSLSKLHVVPTDYSSSQHGQGVITL